MKWKLDIALSSSMKIQYEDNILMMGSCFTENIGHFLTEYKFNPIINPYGILYNPVSISEGLDRLISKGDFQEGELFLHNELYHSWLHHGRFSSTTKKETISKINAEFQYAQEHINKLDVLILTLGSAFVYERIDTNKIVANCHKVPHHAFRKRMLSVEEVVFPLKNTIGKLLGINPGLKLIFTVSPVRHIRDGIIENNRSKATLLLAVEELVEYFNHADYFPSYEILMDELRDYRFYASDLVHPSDIAVQYIWEKFCSTFLGKESLEILEDVKSITKGLKHRPIHEGAVSHQKFKENLRKKIEELERKHPFLKF